MPILYQTCLVPGDTVVNSSDLASILIKCTIYISLLVMLSTEPAKSSRLSCTVVQGAHSTMKPKRWDEWGLKSTSHSPHQCCALAFSCICPKRHLFYKKTDFGEPSHPCVSKSHIHPAGGTCSNLHKSPYKITETLQELLPAFTPISQVKALVVLVAWFSEELLLHLCFLVPLSVQSSVFWLDPKTFACCISFPKSWSSCKLVNFSSWGFAS